MNPSIWDIREEPLIPEGATVMIKNKRKVGQHHTAFVLKKVGQMIYNHHHIVM